jgi:NTE family protein
MRALVLGGGGVAGIAWETGVLYGLGDAVLDVDIIVGTSAGSAVAATVSQISLAEAYEREITPQPQVTGDGKGQTPALDELMAVFAAIQSLPPEEGRRKVAELALSAETIPEESWVRAIGTRLPSNEWPSRKIATVALDTATVEVMMFDRESGVDLTSAVAASCAVPGVYPPVTINGKRYMDGGIRSTTNADLVADYDEVLVVAPFPDMLDLPNARVIAPDADSIAAMGVNVLDPACRIPSAEAGLKQGRALSL